MGDGQWRDKSVIGDGEECRAMMTAWRHGRHDENAAGVMAKMFFDA
jgi:hypothetical protein